MLKDIFIKGAKRTLPILLLVALLAGQSFGDIVSGTVNSPAQGEIPAANVNGDTQVNISFVVFGANDSSIQTEGYSGTTNYDAALQAPKWYFTTSVGSFLFQAQPATNWTIYLHDRNNSQFHGNKSGLYNGAQVNNDLTAQTVLLTNQPAIPARPVVSYSIGDGYVGLKITPSGAIPANGFTNRRFRIYRSDNQQNRAYDRIALNVGGNGQVYKDVVPDKSKTYYYTVVEESGNSYATYSDHSDRTAITPNVEEALPNVAPALTATKGHLQVNLSWTGVNTNNVVGYQLQRRERPYASNGLPLDQGWGAWKNIGLVDGTPVNYSIFTQGGIPYHMFGALGANQYKFQDTSVFWGKEYQYQVSAVNFAYQNGPWSVLAGVYSAAGNSAIDDSHPQNANPTASGSITNKPNVGNTEGGTVYTNVNQILANVTGTENVFQQSQQSGIREFKVYCEGGVVPGWGPFIGFNAPNITTLTNNDILVTLTEGEGAKQINFIVKDHDSRLNGDSGNEGTAQFNVYYDTTAPTISNLSLNDGKDFTNQQQANLSWQYADAPCPSNKHKLEYVWHDVTNNVDSAPIQTVYSGQPTASVLFDINNDGQPDPGKYTLRAKAIDLATNKSANFVESNTVTYDTSSINGSLKINNGALSTENKVVTLTIDSNKKALNPKCYFTQNLSEIINPLAPGDAKWIDWPNNGTKAWTLDPVIEDGFNHVYARLLDPAGNVSGIITGSIYKGINAAGKFEEPLTLYKGINTFSMPFPSPWYVYDQNKTPIWLDPLAAQKTNQITTLLNLADILLQVLNITPAQNVAQKKLTAFGTWKNPTVDTAASEGGATINTPEDEAPDLLAAIALSNKDAYQIFLNQDEPVSIVIKNQPPAQ